MINGFITMHKKSAQNERFMINDDKSFYHWYANLLADAEFREYGCEDFVCGYFSCYFGEVVDCFTNVLCNEVS